MCHRTALAFVPRKIRGLEASFASRSAWRVICFASPAPSYEPNDDDSQRSTSIR